MALLEVTGEHIMQLDDKALRELVVRLCEAELRRAGLPLSALRAGGLQDAPDGGVDVQVELPPDARPLDFIKRPTTRFQCKASKMEPGKIRKEMMPKGVLRPAIRELMAQQGSYIIVSSKETVSQLETRRAAMSSCLSGIENGAQMLLDFYDCEALARWASQYPGASAWVRKQVGQPVDGWRAHGEWAAPRNVHMPYAVDDHRRLWIYADKKASHSIAQGVRELRACLAREGGVARLVGLSGTGKTRLAQALFEEHLDASSSLDRALALYADLADDGHDRRVLTQLQSAGLRAIVVLDNCSSEQHTQYANLCGAAGSPLSLLTLNLDVQDDEPENTQVFRLEPASTEVTAAIVQHEPKAKPLSHTARHRIAELVS